MDLLAGNGFVRRVGVFIFMRYLMWKYGSIPIYKRHGPYVVGWSQSANQYSRQILSFQSFANWQMGAPPFISIN